MDKLNRDEVLFQVKRLYALYELTLSESNSEKLFGKPLRITKD